MIGNATERMSYASMQGSSMRNELTDPVILTFEPQNSTTSILGYPKIIPYTKFEHFGIIRFWVMLRTIIIIIIIFV